jgi:hypothetical protein
MTTFARIENGSVQELIEGPLEGRFHADLIATCMPCEPSVMVGWLWDGVEFTPLPAAPPPPPTDVSFWQFMMAAWKLNFITHAEALAAVRQRIMPPAFADAIADLPAEAKLEAELKFAGITRMLRSDPLFALVVEANIATDEQIDGVFAVAATIA